MARSRKRPQTETAPKAARSKGRGTTQPKPGQAAGTSPQPRPGLAPTGPGLELTANPRLAAFRVLKEVSGGGLPEEVLTGHGLLLSPRDLGLTTALVYEILRHQSRLEELMKSRLAAGKAAPDLALVLKIGLAQLLFFDRVGDHAAVSETVALAKTVTPGRQGLVNAVLRGLLRDRDSGAPWPPAPPRSGQPVSDLAQTYSYQQWLVGDLLNRLGPAETEALLAAGNRLTPPTLRLNPRRGTRDELRALLPFETSPTALSPWGLRLADFSGRPEDWPGFADGRFAVQDEASQLAGLLAGALPQGSAVLDACAGLGGKSLHLAALNPQATITASDKDPAKLDLLTREAARLGCANITTETRDLLNSPPPAAAYDLVVVDAPCSGLGVIRRRPDLKWRKTPADLPRLAGLQLALMRAAAPAVKPGGRLLYAVCSFSRAEGPEAAEKFLAAEPRFRAVPAEAWPLDLRPHLGPEGHLTLWPHRHDTDGFFWAMFAAE